MTTRKTAALSESQNIALALSECLFHRGIVQVVHLLLLWCIVLIHQRPSSTPLTIITTTPHTVARRILRGLPTLLLGGVSASDAKQYIPLGGRRSSLVATVNALQSRRDYWST